MSEDQWLGNDVWDRARAEFDPLNAPLGSWSLTGMRPRQDSDSSYEYVCCGTPIEAQHPDTCPQTPIWGAMCEEYGNALHLWAFGSLRQEIVPFWEIGGGLLINPKYRIMDAGHSRWTISGNAAGRRGVEMSELLKVLHDDSLTLTYQRGELMTPGTAPGFKPEGSVRGFTLSELYEMRGIEDPFKVVSRVLAEELVTLAMSWLNNPTGHIIESDVETLAKSILSALNDNERR